MKNGPTLTYQQQVDLCAEVTKQEIYEGVKDIGSDKAPGIDGYIEEFFKKAWHFIKEEVCGAVKDFFHTGYGIFGLPCKIPRIGEDMLSTQKGLRQGDPILPFLFSIDMEYLSRQLNGVKKIKKYKYHPRRGKLNITHLSFADNLFLFARGDNGYVQVLNVSNNFPLLQAYKQI
ncbi:uncharacterized protein LOC142169702 [Nicotiana tabacum]|uniref:Uncharacterized protein LOC142169702 n=1 Tax=Nicotiana tabacum TaxID=4097 RepID=A0AC58SRV7_TOBAC